MFPIAWLFTEATCCNKGSFVKASLKEIFINGVSHTFREKIGKNLLLISFIVEIKYFGWNTIDKKKTYENILHCTKPVKKYMLLWVKKNK